MAIPARVVGAGAVGRVARAAREARVGMKAAWAVRAATEAAVAAVAGRTGNSYHLLAALPRPSFLHRRYNRCEDRHTSPRSPPSRCHPHMG